VREGQRERGRAAGQQQTRRPPRRASPPSSLADPRALAFEYVKSVVSVSLALLTAAQTPCPRILCVGVGGGSIPHALAAALPSASVTGVELDPAVLDLLPSMGLRARPSNLELLLGDGAAAVDAGARIVTPTTSVVPAYTSRLWFGESRNVRFAMSSSVAPRTSTSPGRKAARVVKRRRTATEVDALHVIGEVEGTNVLIIDDITETAGTLTSAAKMLRTRGVGDIYAGVSHAVLTDLAVQRLEGSEIKELITTDSVPVRQGSGDRVRVLSIAELLGEGIRRIHGGESVSSLFRLKHS
jgi:ribose-phosphate pyrophosphokinase